MGKGKTNTLIQRSATGAIFVGVIIAALLYNSLASFAVMGIAMYFGLTEFLRMTANDSFSKTYLATMKYGAMLLYSLSYLFATGTLHIHPSLWLVPFLIIISIIELYNKNGETLQNVSTAIMGLVYIVLPFSLVHFILNNGAEYNGITLLIIFFLIWANDSFAYLFGVTLGKHRLWERISPKKSWEGFIGGGIVTIILSAVLGHFFMPESLIKIIGLAVIVVIFGTYGDLFESRLKRQHNIKDSGNILPGHGGILDRFDSFLFIIPIALVYLEILN